MSSFFGKLFGKAASLRATSKPDPDAGRTLRHMFLNTRPEQVGLKPSADFPRIFGVALDWPVGDTTATVVSLCDGTASLYTTSTFGIIGGGQHESVRRAAKRFVAMADMHFDESALTQTDPYPGPGQVRFSFLCYDGTRAIEAEGAPIYAGQARLSPLFGAGQDVITQLRQVVNIK